jgi:hypothetical protein
MARETIYRITVLNWDKHNKGMKAHYKKIMISTGFLTDAKIRNLTPATTLLFLSCLLLAGESAQCQFDVTHESLRYQSRVKSGSLRSQLDLLQSLQLVTYEILPSNRIEENRIEENRIERRKVSKPKREKSQPALVPTVVESPPAGAPLTAAALKGDVIGRYYELWADRYQGRAPLMPQDHKKLKDLERNFGEQNAIALVESFFAMPDSWFVSKRHDVQSLMSNLAKVQHFLATGNTVTRRDADAIESSQSLVNQLQRLGGAV